jgi:short-subunit dehydrogenase
MTVMITIVIFLTLEHESTMKKLKGKTVALTGAGSGIGEAVAIQLAKKGCNLALAGRDITKLEETKNKLTGDSKVTIHQVDVSDREAVYKYADAVAEAHGGVDMVINNAGVALEADIEDLTYDDFEWIVNINFWGVVYGTKAFLPYLKKRPEAKIVNMSSVFGIVAAKKLSAYNATKFAVRGFSEAVRQDLEGTSVSVLTVHPGGIKTNLVKAGLAAGRGNDDSTFEDNFVTTAEKCAKDMVKAIQKNSNRIVIGNDAIASDIVQRLIPNTYETLLKRFIK